MNESPLPLESPFIRDERSLETASQPIPAPPQAEISLTSTATADESQEEQQRSTIEFEPTGQKDLALACQSTPIENILKADQSSFGSEHEMTPHKAQESLIKANSVYNSTIIEDQLQVINHSDHQEIGPSKAVLPPLINHSDHQEIEPSRAVTKRQVCDKENIYPGVPHFTPIPKAMALFDRSDIRTPRPRPKIQPRSYPREDSLFDDSFDDVPHDFCTPTRAIAGQRVPTAPALVLHDLEAEISAISYVETPRIRSALVEDSYAHHCTHGVKDGMKHNLNEMSLTRSINNDSDGSSSFSYAQEQSVQNDSPFQYNYLLKAMYIRGIAVPPSIPDLPGQKAKTLSILYYEKWIQGRPGFETDFMLLPLEKACACCQKAAADHYQRLPKSGVPFVGCWVATRKTFGSEEPKRFLSPGEEVDWVESGCGQCRLSRSGHKCSLNISVRQAARSDVARIDNRTRPNSALKQVTESPLPASPLHSLRSSLAKLYRENPANRDLQECCSHLWQHMQDMGMTSDLHELAQAVKAFRTGRSGQRGH